MKRRLKPAEIFVRIVLRLCCITSLYPLIWMLFYSLKNNQEIYVTNTFGFPTHFRVMNYYRAWTTFNIPMYFKNSLIVTADTIVFTLIFSLMFSYAIARMQWKLQNAARLYITLGMFIPVQVIMIPLAVLVKQLHLNNTLGSLIVPYIAFNLAFSSLIFYGYLRNIPFELEESACIDGASIYRCFVSIICPIIRPAIATVIIFIFLQAWNEFSMAYILISNENAPAGASVFPGAIYHGLGRHGCGYGDRKLSNRHYLLVF